MLNKKYRGEEGLLKPFDYDNYGSDNVVIEGCSCSHGFRTLGNRADATHSAHVTPHMGSPVPVGI